MNYIKATDRLPLISSNDVVVIWRGRKYIGGYYATGQYFSGDFGCLSAHNSDWESVKWLDENDDCNQEKRKEAISFAEFIETEGHLDMTQGALHLSERPEKLHDLFLKSLTA